VKKIEEQKALSLKGIIGGDDFLSLDKERCIILTKFEDFISQNFVPTDF